jgi:hypothetical protein
LFAVACAVVALFLLPLGLYVPVVELPNEPPLSEATAGDTCLRLSERVLHFAFEAAEPDEPGAMAALIALKLSQNPQFQDKPGACKLIETAVTRGDQTMMPRLAECRANRAKRAPPSEPCRF